MNTLSAARRVIAIAAVLAWLLLAHPYLGLRHDGVLYLGQVLLHSRVPGLGQDVFFAGGSQDRFSVYSDIVAPLYTALGQQAVNMTLLLGSWVLMSFAVLALARRFGSAADYPYWGLLSFAIMSPVYGGAWIFSYSESFVTARTFAEPLLLWSLVALLEERAWAVVALQILAALLHPLMALPAMAISACYLAEKDRRWLFLLLAIPAALVAAALGLSPWDGLLKTYDPYWWSLVETGNRQVLLANWTVEDYLTVCLDVGVLLAVLKLRRTNDSWTRLLQASVIMTIGLLCLAGVGADGVHSVLLTQLQLWRVHWISHLLAMVLAPWLVARLWKSGGTWKISACALVLALVNSHIGMDHGPAALALCVLVSLAAWRAVPVSPATVRLGCIGIALMVFALSAYQLDGVLDALNWQFPDADWRTRFIKVAAFPVIAMPCFAALLHVARLKTLGLVVAGGGSALLAASAFACWDQRSDIDTAIEAATEPPRAFSNIIHADAQIYWPERLAGVWSLLERPSHFSKQQGAGVLFNRDTALLYGPRRESYRLITEDNDRCRASAKWSKDREALTSCETPALERLRSLCSQPESPNFLVLRGRLKLDPLAVWQPPVRRDAPVSFHLYSCAQLRDQQAIP